MKINLNLIRKSSHSHGEPKGVLVAIPVPSELAGKLYLPGGLPTHEMHVSLAYIKGFDDFKTLVQIVALYTSQNPLLPIMKIGGMGRFFHEDEDVIYASIDSPGLSSFREGLLTHLDRYNVPYSNEHGFVPHITIAYIDKNLPTPRLSEDVAATWLVSSIEVWNNNIRFSL